jgi:hypothetical protein
VGWTRVALIAGILVVACGGDSEESLASVTLVTSETLSIDEDLVVWTITRLGPLSGRQIVGRQPAGQQGLLPRSDAIPDHEDTSQAEDRHDGGE